MNNSGSQQLHVPVLLNEVLSIVPKNGELLVDFTYGLGGHTNAILKNKDSYKAFGFDRDEMALKLSKEDNRLILMKSNFLQTIDFLTKKSIKADFVLMDLGLSSLQLDTASRGFSYSKEGPLDMRMDQSDKMTAEQYINSANLNELIEVFKEYGEEQKAKRIAEEIIYRRKTKKILTTSDLAAAVRAVKSYSARSHNPATLIFQALRIKINDELGQLKYALQNMLKICNKNAVIAIITFNSLEDRIVKQQFNNWLASCVCPIDQPICNCSKKPVAKKLFKKFILPSASEIKINSRSKSAKLRAVVVL